LHQAAFDFDAIYTQSLTEVIAAVKSLNPAEHGVVVIDSISHMWLAAMQAYSGKLTKIGTIPMTAWGKIKRPYKDLMSYLLSSTMHVIICGRQKTEYKEDEETEELKAVGVAMRAEGETAYEPHILIRMEAIKPARTNEIASIVAYIEKDRTGVLAGRSFINPTFESLCVPLLPLLGVTQAQMVTGDAAAMVDAETLAQQNAEREAFSAAKLKEMSARIDLAADEKALKIIGKEITPELKSQMLVEDVTSLREKYLARSGELTRAAMA